MRTRGQCKISSCCFCVCCYFRRVGGGGVEQKVFVGPTEIVSFVFLVVFKDGGFRVNPGFRLFVSDVNQGNEDAG